MKGLYAGFDIGSSAVHCAAVDESGEPVFLLPSRPHLGNPLRGLREQWAELLSVLSPDDLLLSTAFTGIGSRFIRRAFPDAVCEPESVALPRGAARAAPGKRILLHIGARDSFFFRLSYTRREAVVTEWATNTKCGGGSGTLLEKQVRRLYGKPDLLPAGEPERLFRLFDEAAAEAALHPSAEAYHARCGIIIQSDLIHDQNEGFPRPLLVSRLVSTLLRNFKNDVLGGTNLEGGPALVSGGLFS
ncbi:MAG TPA: CoA activase, partial [Synergistales bacterium]|nr:CoA activase [Synergistales bacterium]